MAYITGKNIRALREKLGMTQKDLAAQLHVSDKTVSKWETERGLPDITLLEELSAALRVSVPELLSGVPVENTNLSGNLKRSQFYVCPVCGNAILSVGQGCFSCCGVLLPAQVAEPEDEAHEIRVEAVEDSWYITMDHPMSKSHYISFVACLTDDHWELVKLYPEQDMALRIPQRRRGMLYFYCNRDGMFSHPL